MEQHIALGYPLNFENLDHDDCAGLRRKGEDIAIKVIEFFTYAPTPLPPTTAIQD